MDPTEEKSNTIMADLFSDTVPEKVVEKVVEKAPEKVEPAKPAPAAPAVTAQDDDADVDWDAPIPKKPAAAAPAADVADPELPEDPEAEPANETIARKMAKVNGRELKKIRAEITERNLALAKVEKERDELKARTDELEVTNINPMQHPDFVKARNVVLRDVERSAELLPINDTSLVVQNFGKWMDEYLKLEDLRGAERATALAAMKGKIVDAVGGSDIPYADLDADERATFNGLTTKILEIVQRNVEPTNELHRIGTDLANRAKSGSLSHGIRSYEASVKIFKPVLDAVGDLADDVIAADPHSPESVVARLGKEAPERLKKARADVMEVLTGPRAISQEEIDKLALNGKDVKVFMAERSKAHQAKVLKLAPIFVQALMTRPAFKEALAELATLREKHDSEESELDALGKPVKGGGKAAVVKKDTRSPLDKLFDD